MSNEIATTDNTAPSFFSNEGFALAQRIANAFASSSLVPAAYQGNIANCIIAAEMAHRMQASPLMVMQNLYIVHGNPGWSSKFLVACFNQSGRFSALRYEMERDKNGEPTGCRAWAIEKETGEHLEGTLVTLDMAKAEGWSTKSGSKWKTMPELMLQYRAAAFFIRVYAPEISMGLQTDDEIRDVVDMETGEVTTERVGKPAVKMPTRRAPPVDETPAPAVDVTDAEAKPAEQAAVTEEAPASNTEAKPEVAAEAPAAPAPAATKTVAKAAPQTIGNSTAASEGERKLILNRAKSNGLNVAAMIEEAGVGPMDPTTLEGLTRDGFSALRDLLPKAV